MLTLKIQQHVLADGALLRFCEHESRSQAAWAPQLIKYRDGHTADDLVVTRRRHHHAARDFLCSLLQEQVLSSPAAFVFGSERPETPLL